MGKYFGTDGFRGEANVTLTADHAYQVGRFLGWYYSQLTDALRPCSAPMALSSWASFRGLMVSDVVK